MRAVAVLSVVVVHAAAYSSADSGTLPGRLLAHLNFGVAVFFLISGFLLFRPFIAHRGGGAAPPRVRDYAKRRFLRIYPAYWLVLTVLLIIPGLPSVNYSHLWPMYTLVHTLPIASTPLCSQSIFSCGLAQTWSLVVEVTFYAVLPVYVLVTERMTRRLGQWSWLAAQSVGLAVLSALSLVANFSASSPAWIGWSVTGNVFWFALGMGLAIASVLTWQRPAGRRLSGWLAGRSLGLWGLALALYVVLCLWLAPSPFLFAADQRLVSYVAFGLIALLLLIPMIFAGEETAAPQRAVAHPVMAWLGLISYGVFLCHYAVVLTLGRTHGAGGFLALLAGTLAISVLWAAASYYLLERPVMRLKYRPRLGHATVTAGRGAGQVVENDPGAGHHWRGHRHRVSPGISADQGRDDDQRNAASPEQEHGHAAAPRAEE